MESIQTSYFKQFRYYLNSLLGQQEISMPIGWDEDNKIFKRSLDVHGVFISLANDLKFYSGDNDNNGGYEILRENYNTYGINAKVLIIKEENISGVWIEAYRGYLDFSTYFQEKNTITIKINESGLYELIKARGSEEVEVDRTTTMSGAEIAPMESETVYLEGRKILIIDELKVSRSDYRRVIDLASNDGGIILDKNKTEVVLSFRQSVDYSSAIVPITMVAEQAGNVQTIYDYNCPSSDSGWGFGTASSTGNMFYDESTNDKTIKINFDLEIKLAAGPSPSEVRLELVKYGGNLGLEFRSATTLVSALSPATGASIIFQAQDYQVPLLTGESLALVIHERYTSTSAISFEIVKANVSIYDETYADPSESKFVMPFETLDRIIHIISDKEHALVSTTLGKKENGYKKDGDASLTGLTNGFWVRQFNTSMITTSFKDFIDSFGCIWQIGYGIEKVGFKEKVRVEHISHFYNELVTIKLNGQPDNITRTCAKEYFYSSLNIGYSQPSGTILYEEVLGLDEYNIQNTYTTPITRVENKLQNISKYRADSYGTEFARRKPKSKYPEEDTRYDLNVMVLDLKRGDGDLFQQRKWEDDFVVPSPFTRDTTGIYSPETATNLRFSPVNTVKRLGYWIKGGFMKNLTEYIRYSSSNGNSALKTLPKGEGEYETAENGNILCSDLDKNLFNPEIIEFEFPVDTKLMNTVSGSTIVDGDTIMNYYGLVEFINYEGELEYGYLLSLEPDGLGKFRLLSSTKRKSKFVYNDCQADSIVPPTNLSAVDNTP